MSSGCTPEAETGLGEAGEKKGVLPHDKAPLKSSQDNLSRLTVTLFEALNTSCRVNQFLLAGVERVAGCTDLCVDLFFGRTCLECITAQALNGNLGIIWVNSFFHLFLPQ